jgi:predicted amidohydrolase YtcJ
MNWRLIDPQLGIVDCCLGSFGAEAAAHRSHIRDVLGSGRDGIRVGGRGMRSLAIVLALTGPAACAPSTLAPAPELIVINARVFTADPDRPWAEAVAARDGVFTAVGAADIVSALAGEGTRVVDAGGRLLVPGLTDAHVHLGAYGGVCEQLRPVKLPYPGPTPEELLAAVKAASGDGWLCATVGPAVIGDSRNWRNALDAAAPQRPVVLSSSWGHPTLLNSAAFQALGVTDATPDPVGGAFDRDAAGRLTGIAREGAETLVYLGLTKDLDPADNVAAASAVAQRYLQWGVTGVHLMATGPSLDKTLATLSATDTPLRWSVYGWGYPAEPLDKIWSDAGAASAPANVRMAGVKFVLDGTPIERGAFQRADYADRKGWRGVSNYSDAELDVILAAALEKPGQLALHIAGDAEMERLLAAMEAKAPARQWTEKRVRIEHGDGLGPDLRARAKALGVVVIQNPLHFDPSPMDPSSEAPLGTRFTPQRAAELFPLKSLLAEGIPVALGSDAGGDGANPFLNIMLATLHPMNPPEALAREQALLAYTSGGAFAEGEEKERGIIRAGMRADLALLSQDILSVSPDALPGTRSLLTVVGGKIAYEALQ